MWKVICIPFRFNVLCSGEGAAIAAAAGVVCFGVAVGIFQEASGRISTSSLQIQNKQSFINWYPYCLLYYQLLLFVSVLLSLVLLTLL